MRFLSLGTPPAASSQIPIESTRSEHWRRPRACRSFKSSSHCHVYDIVRAVSVASLCNPARTPQAWHWIRMVATTWQSVLDDQIDNMQYKNPGILRSQQGECALDGQFTERTWGSPHAGLTTNCIRQEIAHRHWIQVRKHWTRTSWVVFACEHFHTDLYGKPFVVQSDHKPLEMIRLKNLHAGPPRLQRMLLRLQNYGVTIKYQPGKTLLLADGLSRLLEDGQHPPIQLDVRVNLVQFSQDCTRSSTCSAAWHSGQRMARYWKGTPKGAEAVLVVPRRVVHRWRCHSERKWTSTRASCNATIRPDSFACRTPGARQMSPQSESECVLERHGIRHRSVCCQLLCMPKTCTFSAEPLLQKDVPPYPWHTLSTDFFELEGEE